MEVKFILTHSIAEKIISQGTTYTPSEWLVKKRLNCHGFFNNINGSYLPWISTSKKAFHAGISEHQGLTDLNDYALGFEITIAGAYNWATFKRAILKPETFTDALYASMSKIYASIFDQYKLDPRTDLLLHSQVSGADVRPDDPKIDPGEGFDYIRLENMVKAEMI